MNSWIPKSKIVKLAVGIAVLSLSFYLAGLFLVVRQTKKVENLYNSIESKSFEGDKVWAIKSIVDANSVNLQTLRSFFVKKGDEVKFIEDIEQVAKNSGIKFEISSIDVKSSDEQSLSDNIKVKMDIEGYWRDIINTIDSLEKLSFGVLVDSINIDTNSEGYWSGSMNFTVFKEK